MPQKHGKAPDQPPRQQQTQSHRHTSRPDSLPKTQARVEHLVEDLVIIAHELAKRAEEYGTAREAHLASTTYFTASDVHRLNADLYDYLHPLPQGSASPDDSQPQGEAF